MKLLPIFALVFILTGCFKKAAELSPKQELGKKLFFDPRLSSDGSISCNSCHNVMNGGVDSRKFAMGVNGALGGRNSPTVFNAVFLSTQFWDGRAKDLADQAKGPLINPVEMGNLDHKEVISRLKNIPGYVAEFKSVFGEDGFTIDNLADAIAEYETTLTTLNSPFDKGSMTELQKKGQETFKNMGCVACHSGEHFAGPTLAVGKGFFQKFPLMPNTESDTKYNFSDDLGLFTVTAKDTDKHMFRVPTLRNIALTAPYFHNGSVNNLDEAVKVMGETQLGKKLSDSEIKEIVAFLNALTGTISPQTMPTLPPTPGTSVAEEIF